MKRALDVAVNVALIYFVARGAVEINNELVLLAFIASILYNKEAKE